MHSWYSDGDLSPQQILAWVNECRLRAWSVTDHDAVDACEFLENAVGFIPGCEFTAEDGGREIHIVGLGIRWNDPQLTEWLRVQQGRRAERIEELRFFLQRQYQIYIPEKEVGGSQVKALTRSHLASALKNAGIIPYIGAAFERYIGDEHCKDLTLPKYPSISEVAELIRAVGGVALLAHPGIYHYAETIEGYMRQRPRRPRN